MPRSDRQVPVVLVAGHLGAGKTTVVNHLLHHAGEARIAVVVNDFGAVPIDAMLVAGSAGSVASLANGCLCCTTDANGLADLLARLTTPDADMDAVVVEASGLAEPRELVRLLLATPSEHVVYGGLVVVVDAAEFAATRTPDLEEQVRVADLVVLNKIDRATGDVADDVRALASGAVAPVTHGAVDPALLVEARPGRRRSAQLSFDSLLRSPASHAHHEHESVSWSSERPLDPRRLAAFLEAGPRGVVRAKGVVRFPGAAPFEVQTVGTAIRVRPAPRHLHGSVDGARLVLIGVGLDADALRAALAQCVADEDRADGDRADEDRADGDRADGDRGAGEPGEDSALLAMLRYVDEPVA